MADAGQEALVGLAEGPRLTAQGQHADHGVTGRHRHADPVWHDGERPDRRDTVARALGEVVVRPDRFPCLEHGGHEPDRAGRIPKRRAHVGHPVHHAQDHLEVSPLLVAQHDRHVGGIEDAAGLDANGLEQGRSIELAGNRS